MVCSAFFSKPFNHASQKGQAVTEYILILVIVVGIALGVIYQFSGAMKKYVQSYFGDYLACLIETGELPSLGSGDGPSAEGCNANFEPFSIKNGRPLMADSGSGGSSKKGGAGGGLSRTSRASNSPKVTRSRNFSPNAERGAGYASSNVATPKKNGATRGGFSSDSSSSTTRISRLQASRGQFRLSNSFSTQEDKKELAAQRHMEGKLERGGSPRKLAYTPPQGKKGLGMNDENVNLGFGDYLRYLLIGAIVIAIVFVVGGQLMQVRRNSRVE